MLPVGEIDISPHIIAQGDATNLPYEDKEFHAVVTDPPYGLAFMGKTWDDFESKGYQEWCEEWALEALRVLKPGGHMLAFSGTRTYHRMVTGVEDAGFEIRDKIDWLYGSGFPKTQNVSRQSNNDKWEGLGTALKPAHESVVVARKPLEEDTIVEQLKSTETGVFNIDETRLETDDDLDGGRYSSSVKSFKNDEHHEGYERDWMHDDEHIAKLEEEQEERIKKAEKLGRFPSNVCVGPSISSELGEKSKFFYEPKTKKKERTMDGKVDNPHPTVKPTDLMAYLVRLVTLEGQKVCDPFLGSGTTLMACNRENRVGYGMDKDREYCDIATKRLGVDMGMELGSLFDY